MQLRIHSQDIMIQPPRHTASPIQCLAVSILKTLHPSPRVTLPVCRSNMKARRVCAALHALRLRPREMKYAFYTLEGPSQDDRGRGPL
jgi:hypothetical protein